MRNTTITGYEWITQEPMTGTLVEVRNPRHATLFVDALVNGELRILRVTRADLDGVTSVSNMMLASEGMLWHVAELNWHGLGEAALAVLQHREHLAIVQRENDALARRLYSRRSADAFMGRIAA